MDKMLSTRTILLPPRDIFGCCHGMGRGEVLTEMLLNHSMHKVASTRKNYLTQNVNSAEVEELYSRK
jgi:hypothetical protein